MIDEALLYYNFLNPKYTFIRHNENMTYQVIDGNNKFLLRIHKAAAGLNFSFQCGETPREVFIHSEIELLMKMLSDTNIRVQQPIANKLGEYVTKLRSGHYVTALSWFDGEDLRNATITSEIVYNIGKLIGSLHNLMSRLPYFHRYSYDEDMIGRVLNEIKKAFELQHIEEKHYECIRNFLLGFSKLIRKEKKNFILVHADLSKSNLILQGNELIPIDFSLSGYALPEMDLADMSCSLNDKTLTSSLLDGYRHVSEYSLNEFYVDVYFAFSIVLYIAYHHENFVGDEKSQNSLERWTTTIIEPIVAKME